MAPQRRGAGGNRRTQDDDQEDDDGGLTDAMRDEIGQIVNAAVSGHVQRRLPGIVQQAIAGPIGELRTLLEGRSGRSAGADDEPDDDEEPEVPARRGARGAGVERGRPAARGAGRERERANADRGQEREQDPPDNRKMSKLEAQVAKLTQEREQERQAARQATRDGALRELLGTAGVDKNRLRGAAAVLRDSTKYDDKTNEWYFVRKVDGVDEEVDLETGVRDWSATDEGKSYLAPPSGGGGGFGGGQRQQTIRSGSGTRTGGGNGAPRSGTNNPATDAKTAKAQNKAQAMQNLTGAINELAGGTMPLG